MRWHPLRFFRSRGVQCLALLALGIALSGLRANAQATINNGYLTLTVDAVGNIAITTRDAPPADPARIILNPLETLSNGSIAYSRVFVRIDDGLNLNLISGADEWLGQFGWLQAPTAINNSRIEARYQAGPVFQNSPDGTSILIGYTTQIDMVASFVHDQVRFQFTVTNTDVGPAHRVALAFVQDIEVTNNAANSDGPIRLSSGPVLRNEAQFVGSAVPQYWESFFALTAPGPTTSGKYHSIRGTLRPASSTQTEPTPPTRFIYARADRVSGTDPERLATLPIVFAAPYHLIWNLTADPAIRLDRPTGAGPFDAGVALYWDAETLANRQTKTIVTYLGMGNSSVDLSPPLALAVEGPSSLRYVSGAAQPNPFQITAYVQNMTDLLPVGGLSLGPITLFLDIPAGLRLADGETATKQIATLGAGAEASVTWNVVPDGTATGEARYSVAASANIGGSKLVQRTLEIPALPMHDVVTGYQMISLPFSFANALPSTVLGLDPSQFDIVRWNPVNNRYEPVSTFQPGLAYWLRMQNGRRLNITGGAPLENQTTPGNNQFVLTYQRGWNQIGNPYVYNIQFSDIQILDPESLTVLDFATAASSAYRWVQAAIYSYDPEIGNYVLIENLGSPMRPYEGYWVRLNRPSLQFIYPTVDVPGSSVTRSAMIGVGAGERLGRNTANNWRLRLVACGAETADIHNYIGIAPKATDGPDVYKLEKPPMLEGRIALDIIHADWPQEAGARFAQDLRAPGLGRKTWDLIVRGSKPNEEITISWPEIAASVPRDYNLTLVDKDTNERRALRNTSSYVVNTGSSGTRRIQIVAEPSRAGSRLRITSLDVVSNGGGAGRSAVPASVAINYVLSDNADARITIRDARGRSVRTLATTTRAAGDTPSGSALWDLKDQRGIALPSGLYNVELVALTQDGQRTRQTRPYLLTR